MKAMAEFLDNQIPASQLKGAKKKMAIYHLHAISVYGNVGGRQA